MTAIGVQPWPGPLRGPGDALQVVAVVHAPATSRALARERIRLALRQVAAAALDLAADRLTLHSTPGSAPRLLLDGKPCGAGVSISHTDGAAFAAFHAHGAIGIDVMPVQDIADWREVARDYLGPDALALLAATPAPRRPLALAQAWTRREAQLKCLGLALGEWTAQPDHCRYLALELPAGYAGALAILGERDDALGQ